MNVESQTIINIALAAFSSGLGWFARELWTAVKELKSDLAKLREELPKTYVTKDDWRTDMAEIKGMLSKIFDEQRALLVRLEEKADR